ncbi:glucose 1-dehydrogenase [Lysinibacillus telephonicus]|uniref:Glucose 1-dehydrogenase n=1 Tax=Lysinibacillus telephonicus TaxID=1714840 RepID=A0A3S0HNQ6_9BACI|nr:glucose 1-dehydrogenase [Lysinibacillus telephonicus]RTQ96078.1 glucose 1-dehydrogenase [Lysinibacillus telephonicus]
MGKFDNKVVLITGGSRGQGAAHARAFVEEGAKVAITDVLVEDGQALAAELGDNATFLKHDVTSELQWTRIVEQTEEIYGPINVLVNNAGIVISKPFEELSEAEYRKVIDINQVGVFLGMKAVVPSLKKSGNGVIINISSINGLRGSAGTLAYDASKFAVRGMTKSAAIELAPYGIRVNSIHPGVILTPMVSQSDVADVADQLAENVPLKRAAQPEEVSKLVLFLAGDASYSTGSEFILDGGLTAKY